MTGISSPVLLAIFKEVFKRESLKINIFRPLQSQALYLERLAHSADGIFRDAHKSIAQTGYFCEYGFY